MEEQLAVAIFSAEFRERAFPVYAEMRHEGPVSRLTYPDGRHLWLVTQFEEASEFLKDYGRFANDIENALTEEEYNALFQSEVVGLTAEQQEVAMETDRILSRNLLALDPPDHSRLRRLVAIPFTPRYIEGLRARVQAIADGLLDDIEQTGRREMELIDDFAYPLPLIVIAEMLGIPEEDRDKFRDWSQAAVTFNPGQPPDPETTAKLVAFIQYLRELVAEKRADPGDDLLSGLVVAEAEGDKLTEEELLSMMFLLIVAGHETTVNLIANGTLALFEHPDQFDRLKAEPELLKSAIEEMLRYYGPVELSLSRWVREDTEFGGVQLPRGGQMMALLASANRDESRFPNPEQFDITREPNRHLAFGTGLHSCLGATLARLEAQVAFTALLSRLPHLSLSGSREALRWRDGTFLRGLTRLPVTF